MTAFKSILNRIHITFTNLINPMACRARELVSLFFYKICNPRRSDNKIEEHVGEEEEAELNRLRTVTQLQKLEADAELKRLKIPLEKPEAQLNMSVAEQKSFKAILESKTGSSSAEEEKHKNHIPNQDIFIPDDLVRLILSCVALKDNIRCSVVCKTWSEIASSVRLKDKPYWLMYLITCNTRGVSYGFYDPVAKKKTKAMTLPELSMDSKIFCSNDGWLLIRDYSPHGNICFFNPFTRQRINLHFPKYTICSTTFAFTCAPTKIGCLVVGIGGFPDSVYTTISTWHPGAVTWVHGEFRNEISSHFRHTKNIIYLDGLFYMATEIALGVFDPSVRTWNVLPMQPILGVGPRMRTLRWMTEYTGQIYLVDASYLEPVVFRLNRLESVWEKKETLDGCSIYVSNGLCVITSSLTGSMSNILYIWNNDINGRRPTKYMCTLKRNRPYKYSLYNRTLCEDPEGYYFEYRTRRDMDGVWIEPPLDISIYDFSIIDPSDAINTRLFV